MRMFSQRNKTVVSALEGCSLFPGFLFQQMTHQCHPVPNPRGWRKKAVFMLGTSSEIIWCALCSSTWLRKITIIYEWTIFQSHVNDYQNGYHLGNPKNATCQTCHFQQRQRRVTPNVFFVVYATLIYRFFKSVGDLPSISHQNTYLQEGIGGDSIFILPLSVMEPQCWSNIGGWFSETNPRCIGKSISKIIVNPPSLFDYPLADVYIIMGNQHF